MKSVGEKLRRERIRQNIDLETLANRTRISARYLNAIENGNPDDLPGGFFYRSFVRQYALAVGLDTDQIEADLERVREAEAPVLNAALQTAEFPIKQPDQIVTNENRRLSRGRVWSYVAALAVVLVACTFFYSWWRKAGASAQAHDSASISEPAADAAKPPVQESKTNPTAPTQPGPIGVPVGASSKPPSETKPLSQPPAQAAASEPNVTPDHRVVLNLTAIDPVWLSVVADGKTIFSGLLNANESRTLAGKSLAQIRVGNAGGLAITWNGKSIGPLGPKGQVRTVVLTPDTYKITAPMPVAQVTAPTGSL